MLKTAKPAQSKDGKSTVDIKDLMVKHYMKYFCHPSDTTSECGYLVFSRYANNLTAHNIYQFTWYKNQDLDHALAKLRINNDHLMSIPTNCHIYNLCGEDSVMSCLFRTLGNERVTLYAHSSGKVYTKLEDLVYNHMHLGTVIRVSYIKQVLSLNNIFEMMCIKKNPNLSSLTLYQDYTILSSDGSSISCHKAVLVRVPFFKLLFTSDVSSDVEKNSQLILPYSSNCIEAVVAFVYGRKMPMSADIDEVVNLLCMWYPENEELVKLREILAQ